MRIIKVDTTEGTKEEKVYSIDDFPYSKYSFPRVSVKHGKDPCVYLELSSAFDIETTNMDELRPWAYMYHWQVCIEKDVCFGRRWEEFLTFLDRLRERLYLANNRRLVIWVHNLPFEFQFMRFFLDVQSGFFRDERKPLKVVINGFEFRDSYALSNMSLSKFCENTPGVVHYKIVDTYDYSKLRTPDTPMTPTEEAYCYNDVRGLCECITEYRKHDKLASMPMTSTGYVRRDFRHAMKTRELRKMFLDTALNDELYTWLKNAFRGGNTHANVWWVGEECRGAASRDIASSYPFQMMVRPMPMYKFFRIPGSDVRDYIAEGKYAVLTHVVYTNIKYVGVCGNPYISIAQCKHKKGVTNDNGRVLEAEHIELYLTDIDFRIIEHDYVYEDCYIDRSWASKYGQLPKEFKETLLGYYIGKTQLKGIPEKEYEYGKAKNRLNAAYGMTVTAIDKSNWTYKDGEYVEDLEPLGMRLDRFYRSRNSFLPYQWGIWIVSWARWQLSEMLWKVGKDVLYCDTDSIKYLGDHTADFEEENKKLRAMAEEAGAYADDSKGSRRYMGIWEPDGEYETFKTLGAKKYCYRKPGEKEIYSTIAGVSKKVGHEYFTKHGFDAFKVGTTIPKSGHLVAYYNDTKPKTVTVEGCTFTTASNIALLDGDYTIGQTAEYLDLLEKALEQKSLIM